MERERREREYARERLRLRRLRMAKYVAGLLLAAALIFLVVRVISALAGDSAPHAGASGAARSAAASSSAGDVHAEHSLAEDSPAGDSSVQPAGVLSQEPGGISEEEIRARLNELEEKFPSGSYWNHWGMEEEWSWDMVTDTPCEHSAFGEEFCNSYDGRTGELFPQYNSDIQCLGFASMLSDEIFGRDAPVLVHRSYDRLQVGDQIRLTMEKHSMVVVEKTETAVQVAECNADYETCRIDWGRELSREELENYGEELEYLTRRGE